MVGHCGRVVALADVAVTEDEHQAGQGQHGYEQGEQAVMAVFHGRCPRREWSRSLARLVWDVGDGNGKALHGRRGVSPHDRVAR